MAYPEIPKNEELPSFDDTGIDRKDFWWRVDRRGPTECWPWRGPRSQQGYGRYRAAPGERPKLVHRIAYGLTFGTAPEAVCHQCDRPDSVSPCHFVGADRAWNNLDAKNKGRSRNGRHLGVSHHNARLSEDDVRAIRRKHAEGGVTLSQLGQAFGTTKTTIQGIVARTRWKHLADAPGTSDSEAESV